MRLTTGSILNSLNMLIVQLLAKPYMYKLFVFPIKLERLATADLRLLLL